jgi:hypothetical protein
MKAPCKNLQIVFAPFKRIVLTAQNVDIIFMTFRFAIMTS